VAYKMERAHHARSIFSYLCPSINAGINLYYEDPLQCR
jgi:hypothetical protein